MAEEEGEFVVDGALAVVQVGVAHAAREDLHSGLAGTRVGDDDRLEGDGGVLLPRDDALDLNGHA